MNDREITFSDSINEALRESMRRDPKVLCYGLGVTDPKAVFNTTYGLEEEFGSERVFDIPCSENGITGIAIGAALKGYRSVLTHQRLDFALLSMDQIVNSAAKWHYMFGSQRSVPITVRMIVGRGWGQGPTHSQNLQSWFSHIPGLKVVVPSNAYDAKGLLIASIFDPNPVIFLEHRWLHNSISAVPDELYEIKLGQSKLINTGDDMTIVTNSYMIPECIDAVRYLKDKFSISCDLIDMYSIRPYDQQVILKSVVSTKSLLCVDTAWSAFSMSSEVISMVVNNLRTTTGLRIQKLGLPDKPEPTSFGLTKEFYLNADNVINKVLEMNGLEKQPMPIIRSSKNHDKPGEWFRGPF